MATQRTPALRTPHPPQATCGSRSCVVLNYQSFTYAGRADEALAQLDEGYTRWLEGVRGLDEEALARPVGEAEGPWADRSMAVLVLHIHREVIHHMAEIALLRDLWAHGLR